ncbi:MAG: SdrD B-like domain-containing protein [Anaerolineales bacterium]
MKKKFYVYIGLWLAINLACSLTGQTATPPSLNSAQATIVAMQVQLTQLAAQQTPPNAPQNFETQAPTEALIVTPTLLHLKIPGEPARPLTAIFDTISGNTAQQGVSNQPPGGDEYLYNLYERPFNAQTMDIFFPDLDIREAKIGPDNTWMFVTIYLFGLRGDSNALQGAYRLELDLDIDGRGDWLFEARAPFSEEWKVEGVRVWEDTDNDVGGEKPCYADPPQVENSYDRLVFDQGYNTDDPDAAWARYKPGTPPAVQIAFKYSLINNDDKFMWGVWADQGVDQPQWYDYNDHFTYEEAGSPFRSNRYYPIKLIAEVDNTCRWTYGFEPKGDEPCLCAGGKKEPTPTPIKPTKPPATTQALQYPGDLGGYVFKDMNKNCNRDEGDGGFGGLRVTLKQGACPGGAVVATTTTGAWGRYFFSALQPGRYCVIPANPGVPLTPPNATARVQSGTTTDNVNFGYCP